MVSSPPPPPPPPPLPRPTHFTRPLRSSQKPSPPPPPQMPPDTVTPIERSYPCQIFVYGSLMDPEVVQAVLNSTELSDTKPATISGYQIRMWGIYPALVPASSGKVAGCVWEVKSEDQFNRLVAYETAAYRDDRCTATLEDGTTLSECWTFCWAGESDSRELEEGSFDLERYQKYFKPSVTRKR